MASVFLSYDRQDAVLAARIARQLEAAGFDVWWDRQIAAGSEYSREIEQALREAAAVIVLWSSNSVESPWVRDEAAKGRDSGRLIPATLDGTEPPLGFGQFHTIDLSRRSFGKRSPGVKTLVAATRQKVDERSGAGEPSSTTSAAAPATSAAPALYRPTLVFGVVALVGVLIAAAYLLYGALSGPDAAEPRGGKVAIAGFEPLTNDSESRRVARLSADAVERIFATNFIQTVSTAAGQAPQSEADFAIRGTVDRNQDEFAVSADVVDLGSGRTLWSTQVSRSATEGAQLAEELGIWLADVLRCSIYTKRRMPKYGSAEVYSRIFRNCEAERSRGEQYDQLPALAQALVDVAPKSAQAHAYLANAIAFRHPDRIKEVYSAAKKALELDPRNGAVRWSLAAVHDPNVTLSDRERHLREGMVLDPDFIWLKNHLGLLTWKVGRIEEAATLFTEFVGDYPLDFQQRAFLGYLLALLGRMREAREQFERLQELRPGYRYTPVRAIGAELFFGDPARARGWMDKLTLVEDDRRCIETTIDALLAKRSLTLEQINQNCRGARVISPEQVLARFGHTEEVIRRLDELDPQGFRPRFGPNYVYEPDFAAARADPRFIPLMARFGIPQYWLETNKWPDFCREDDLPYDCRRAAEAAVKRNPGS